MRWGEERQQVVEGSEHLTATRVMVAIVMMAWISRECVYSVQQLVHTRINLLESEVWVVGLPYHVYHNYMVMRVVAIIMIVIIPLAGNYFCSYTYNPST